MTCREKLAMEHPEYIGDPRQCSFAGGCRDCPDDYGYLEAPYYCDDDDFGDNCTKCWDREIPGTEGLHLDAFGFEAGRATNTKKESNTMEKKTKAQLIEEINNMKKELEKLDRYRQYEDAANEMYAMYEAMVNAGFTKEQAWELFIAYVKMAPNFTR